VASIFDGIGVSLAELSIRVNEDYRGSSNQIYLFVSCFLPEHVEGSAFDGCEELVPICDYGKAQR
jgi:hypothetical protein